MVEKNAIKFQLASDKVSFCYFWFTLDSEMFLLLISFDSIQIRISRMRQNIDGAILAYLYFLLSFLFLSTNYF